MFGSEFGLYIGVGLVWIFVFVFCGEFIEGEELFIVVLIVFFWKISFIILVKVFGGRDMIEFVKFFFF